MWSSCPCNRHPPSTAVPAPNPRAQAASSTDLKLVVRDALADSREGMTVLVWNYAGDSTWSASVAVTKTETGGSTGSVTTLNGRLASTEAAIRYGYSVKLSSMNDEVQISMTSLSYTGTFRYGVLIIPDSDLAVSMAPTHTIGGDATSFRVPIMGPYSTSRVEVKLTAPFITERYIIKQFVLTMAGLTETAMPAATSDMGYFSAGSSYVSSVSISSGMQPETLATTATGLTATFQMVPRSTGTAVLAVLFPDFSASGKGYNWTASGPFFTGSVGGSGESITRYPQFIPGVTTTVTVSGTDSALNGMDSLYEVSGFSLDSLWWNITMEMVTPLRNLTGDVRAGELAFAIMSDPAAVSSFGAPAVTGTMSPTYERLNANLAVGSPTSATLNTFRLLSPAMNQGTYRTRAFIIFGRASTSGSNYETETSTVRMHVDMIGGDCASYADCHQVATSDHPSVRAALSASGDPLRLRHCMLLPSESTPTRPEGRCVECSADCDCGAGQYCHMDTGVCPVYADASMTVSSYKTCDKSSRQLTGLCRPKDPTNTILGKPCRSTTPQLYSTMRTNAVGGSFLTSVVAQASSIGLFSEGQEAESAKEEQITGARFCGSALYYNASFATESYDMYGLYAQRAARAALWSGTCIGGVCQECGSGTTACSDMHTCVNGRYMDTVTVDGTARTFNENVLAGLLLAVVMMIVLLQGCVCLLFLQARSHRKEDDARAAQREAELAAAAESLDHKRAMRAHRHPHHHHHHHEDDDAKSPAAEASAKAE